MIWYQQIISTAITKFKGLAWLAYNEQFGRTASGDVSLRWDAVNLELSTITFYGLAKPHCPVCSSPHHSTDNCHVPTQGEKLPHGSLGLFWLQQESWLQSPSKHLPPCVPPMQLGKSLHESHQGIVKCQQWAWDYCSGPECRSKLRTRWQSVECVASSKRPILKSQWWPSRFIPDRPWAKFGTDRFELQWSTLFDVLIITPSGLNYTS